jgi:hypothetical protein
MTIPLISVLGFPFSVASECWSRESGFPNLIVAHGEVNNFWIEEFISNKFKIFYLA